MPFSLEVRPPGAKACTLKILNGTAEAVPYPTNL
jgi:hypothetical protein